MKVFIAEVGPNRYSVNLEDGTRLLNKTRLPFYDSARALARLGHTGIVEMWDYTQPYPRMTGDIEKVAKLTVKEDDAGLHLIPYEPFPDKLKAP